MYPTFSAEFIDCRCHSESFSLLELVVVHESDLLTWSHGEGNFLATGQGSYIIFAFFFFRLPLFKCFHQLMDFSEQVQLVNVKWGGENIPSSTNCWCFTGNSWQRRRATKKGPKSGRCRWTVYCECYGFSLKHPSSKYFFRKRKGGIVWRTWRWN